MFSKPQARDGVRALVGAAVLGSTVGLAIGGAYLAGGLARATVVHAQIQRLAGAASGGFSDVALHAATGDGDAAVLAIAKQHDPQGADFDDERDRQVADLVERLQARRAVRAAAPAALARQSVRGADAPSPVLKAAYVHAAARAAAAEPFHLRGALDQTRDLECLTQAVYYEARGEPVSGQRAVAQVILNRVRHPAFPKSICGVVFQGVKNGGCQFSFACDGQPHHPMENAAWRRSEGVAAEALKGEVMTEVGDATHFHAAGHGSGLSAGLLKVAQIGAHVFYRFSGHAGAASMFHEQAQPSEPANAPHPLFASLSLTAPSGQGAVPARFFASASQAVEHASAAVEHAASVVENAAKGVAAPEAKAETKASAPQPKAALPGVEDAPRAPTSAMAAAPAT